MDRKGRNKQGRNLWQQALHVWLYTDLLQALKGERLSSVFSPDGTLISASTAPYCGGRKKNSSNKESGKKKRSNKQRGKKKSRNKTYILHNDILSVELECSHLYWRDLSVDLPLNTCIQRSQMKNLHTEISHHILAHGNSTMKYLKRESPIKDMHMENSHAYLHKEASPVNALMPRYPKNYLHTDICHLTPAHSDICH